MILTVGDDRSFISTCPPEFDPDSLKRNDGANFNYILDCPPVWSCPTSLLGFRCSVCMKGLVICKDGVFMWDFWNFKVIPSTKIILIAQSGHVTSVLQALSICRKWMVICKNYFHVKLLEFQSHSKHKNHFDVCLTNLFSKEFK